MTRNFIFIYTV